MKDRGQKANATGSKKLNSSSYNRVCLQTLKSPSVSAMKMACPSRGISELLSTEEEGVRVSGNRCPTLTRPHTGNHSK